MITNSQHALAKVNQELGYTTIHSFKNKVFRLVVQGERIEIVCLKLIRDLKCDIMIFLGGTRWRYMFWIVGKFGIVCSYQ